MRDMYTTPEGFELPRPLLLPAVRDFADLFEYVREWDHTRMTATDGVVPNRELAPSPVRVDRMDIGPFLSAHLAGGARRGMAVRATPATVSALCEPSPLYASIVNEGRISFELFEHVNNGRVLVTAHNNQDTGSQYLAYIDPATIPPRS